MHVCHDSLFYGVLLLDNPVTSPLFYSGRRPLSTRLCVLLCTAVWVGVGLCRSVDARLPRLAVLRSPPARQPRHLAAVVPASAHRGRLRSRKSGGRHVLRRRLRRRHRVYLLHRLRKNRILTLNPKS